MDNKQLPPNAVMAVRQTSRGIRVVLAGGAPKEAKKMAAEFLKWCEEEGMRVTGSKIEPLRRKRRARRRS